MLSIREKVIPELRGKGNLLNVYVVPYGDPEYGVAFDQISAPDAEFVMKPVSPFILIEHFDGAILGEIHDDEFRRNTIGELSFWKSPLDAIREIEQNIRPIEEILYDPSEPLVWDIDGVFLFLKHRDDFRDLLNDTLPDHLKRKIRKASDSDVVQAVNVYFP